MANIKNNGPKQPLWPWGGPRGVRERLIDTSQLDKKRQAQKAGDPKNPALASTALLESIGYARGADDLRLPEPQVPPGHQADLAGFLDGPQLAAVAEKFAADQSSPLGAELSMISITPERKGRLEALLERERDLLALIARHHGDMEEVRARAEDERRREARS